MTVRRVLIFAPILLILVLLQSYFWVPTYEQQTKGNPARLTEYISGSIGDASLLNPILSADSSSSTINGLVFEGLIDRDKELRFRGRLAESWEIFEEAFFYVNPSARIPGLGPADAHTLAEFIQHAKKTTGTNDPDLKDSLNRITDISVLPSRTFTVSKSFKESNTGKEKTIDIRVAAPPRIKMVLKTIDQDIFQNLTHLLGKNYFDSFDTKDYLKSDFQLSKEQRAAYTRAST